LAFNPPDGALPSFLVHAGDLAIENSDACKVSKSCNNIC